MGPQQGARRSGHGEQVTLGMPVPDRLIYFRQQISATLIRFFQSHGSSVVLPSTAVSKHPGDLWPVLRIHVRRHGENSSPAENSPAAISRVH
jgi:hypothetical protein